MWQKIQPLLPPRKIHPLGCHRPRVPDRAAMDAIFCVLRTGCQWNALKETKRGSAAAHRRFQEWTEAGVFLALWKEGVLEYDKTQGIDWSWLSMDGAMTKAPLGGKKTGMCLDKGYDYTEVRELMGAFGFTAHIRARAKRRRP